MFKLDLEKAEEPEIKLPISVGSSEKQESFKKTSTFALLITPKPLTVWITTNYGKFWKRWEYQTTWPASWEICTQVRMQQLKPDMEQQTRCKLGKENVKAVYCHPACLTYIQSTSYKMPGWMKHKMESRLSGEISITTDTQMTPLSLMAEIEELKSPLIKVKEESEKVGLNSAFRKWRSWHLVPSLHGK